TLTDLDGYRLYWGTTPGTYPNTVTIDNPSVTTYLVENLAPGTYQFVATSFNTAGVESDYSSPATKIVP
ncbi:MAG: fibronectin type III domain-containing protein, partial [Woeseiaceae bacterium]|nr:fibronectin type III domain-containing protein [Woeseiaceae bacterium]